MSLALVHSRAQCGVDAPPVRVEVHLSGGLPGMSIVGLPETAVKESKDRVRAALLCARFDMPQRRITVNLAPADLPKEGGRFDLPIALGILAASGQLPQTRLADYEFLGELALTGELRGVQGALSAVLAAAREQHGMVLPSSNADEAALTGRANARIADTLLEVCAFLRGESELVTAEQAADLPDRGDGDNLDHAVADLADVRGQAQARRALEVAAAGAHNLLMSGPPGSGKSMLAQRLPGILPPLGEDEALEAAAIASLGGRGVDVRRWRIPPYRQPHHTASGVALVGGGCQF
jgi:magnesium chelatase family protein